MVEEHGPVLYRMAFRMVGDRHEAEDLVQETFRSAWKSRARYRSGRGDRAWLASILRRRAIDQWRRKKPPQAISDEWLATCGKEAPDPARDEIQDEIQQALSQLPEQLRESLLLVVVGELTHQEVADLLAVPLGTVLSRVSRARTRLRKLLLQIA
jgi:RNA polymerase sigma-70 factor (ECF subfamily)